MSRKRRKKLNLKERKMSENRINGAMEELNKEPELTKIELADDQAIAVHLLQEREQRQATILEMNELLKLLEAIQNENAELRRQVYQERLNAISRDNADLRRQYSLPDGNAKYAIEDGKMFLIKAAEPAPQLETNEDA